MYKFGTLVLFTYLSASVKCGAFKTRLRQALSVMLQLKGRQQPNRQLENLKPKNSQKNLEISWLFCILAMLNN
jgi:hypothetical protein